jgi:biopolymer transport protein TolR
MGMKTGGGGDELNSEINVTPLVDVMLVLLIIFMVTAPMLNTGVELDLPQVTAQKLEDSKEQLVLSITKDRKLLLGKASIKWSDLQKSLAANEKVKKDGVIFIEGDSTLPYAVVVTAMALAKDAGVPKVQLLTDPTEHIDTAALDKGLVK